MSPFYYILLPSCEDYVLEFRGPLTEVTAVWKFLREMLEPVRIMLITHWNKEVLRIGRGNVLCSVNLSGRGRIGDAWSQLFLGGYQLFHFFFNLKENLTYLIVNILSLLKTVFDSVTVPLKSLSF